VDLISSNYVEAADLDKVMRGAMKGLADGLDPDSAYLSPEQVKEVEAGTPLPPADVGIELTRQYYLRVIAARDDSPAAKAGLQTGDYVRAIDGKPARDLSVFEGMRLLRGAPGTKVTLVVIRGNAADPHTVELVRERPAPAKVSGRIAADGVGYVRVPAFTAETPAAVKSEIAALEKQGAAKIVVDVRRTAEGPLEAGIETARLFVPSGTLVIRAGRNSTREPIAASAGDGAVTLPVAVLVNGGTSGAAELFAAALAGNKRADLVGERTSGRAGVQKLVRLPEGHGLWLTYVNYLTPSGDAIHERGLVPGVEAEEPDVEFGTEPDPSKGDPVLEKALEKLGAAKKAAL
jgi:carboxyl-terminal processing protease